MTKPYNKRKTGPVLNVVKISRKNSSYTRLIALSNPTSSIAGFQNNMDKNIYRNSDNTGYKPGIQMEWVCYNQTKTFYMGFKT
jgi:hypothetical protein